MQRCAASLVLLALGTAALPSAAQSNRNFPATALRAELAFGQPPLVEINGKPARLAPGARIKGENNLLQMSAALAGTRALVHYTRDEFGLLKDVWLLTAAEASRKPWPTTPEQAGAWQFDPVGQTWTKP